MKLRRWHVLLGGASALCATGASWLGWMAMQPGATDFLPGEPSVSLAAYRGPSPSGVPGALAGASKVSQGEYLALAADCMACHTAPGGRPFAGGRAFVLPFGTLYSPNITPDRATGIGAWSDAEFIRALRRGVGRDGQRLYPAFPYASYALLTDEDILAIKAYLLSLPPVTQVTRPSTFAFPFNQRWSMTLWSALFVPDEPFRPVPARSAQWNRGAYLVEAAAHCGECHTPRNPAFAMDTRRKFAGAQADGWNAYNITSDAESGIGDWAPDHLARYLSAQDESVRVAAGPMGEVVDRSLSHLTREDIDAIATYLRSVPALHDDAAPRVAAQAPRSVAAGPSDNPIGKRVFEGACIGCHAWDGSGSAVPQAHLTGLRTVNDASGSNVMRMVLFGSKWARPGRPAMPGFAASLSDAEVAGVTNYVVRRFGGTVSGVSAEQVSKARVVE